MSSSLHRVLVMLFIHVGKHSNSRSQMFFETGALKNFAIFTGKHLCWILFLRLQRRCFPVNIAKFLRTPFFTEHLRWLLLSSLTLWAGKWYSCCCGGGQ